MFGERLEQDGARGYVAARLRSLIEQSRFEHRPEDDSVAGEAQRLVVEFGDTAFPPSGKRRRSARGVERLEWSPALPGDRLGSGDRFDGGLAAAGDDLARLRVLV